MNRTERLLRTLRQVMRSRGLKYQDLAEKLNLSLPTIKRVFNQGNDVSLERLESMCVAAGVDFYDLVELARKEQADVSMTEEQEELLTDERMLALFFSATCNLNRLQVKAFGHHSDAELDSGLRVLESSGLIERHTHGRLKSRFSFFSLRWIPRGPFERRYGKEFSSNFFKEAFGGDNGFSGFRQLYLTRTSLETLSMKMNDLVQEAVTMSKADLKSDMMEIISVGVLASTHPWIPEILRRFYRPDKACASRLRLQLEECATNSEVQERLSLSNQLLTPTGSSLDTF